MTEFDVHLMRGDEIDTRNIAARDEVHAWETARELFVGPEPFCYDEILAVEPASSNPSPTGEGEDG